MNEVPLLAWSDQIDRAVVRRALEQQRFAQISEALAPDVAEALWQVLRHQTPYGLAWAGDGQPTGQYLRAEQMRSLPPDQKAAMGNAAARTAGRGSFAFLYGQYPLAEAAREQWHPGHPLYGVLDFVNDAASLDLARAVSGHADIVCADAQATLYAGGHFLTQHDDHAESQGRRLAYVLNLTKDWQPDWGGYLNILDERGDIVAGFMPRFNTLNLFLVPLRHQVSLVAPFAPVGRVAITGWFRNC